MKILLDGYIDSNLGDDLMLALAARGLADNELYTTSEKLNIENVRFTGKRRGYDYCLKVIGSGFLLHNNSGIPYRLREMSEERRSAKKLAVIGCSLSAFTGKAAEMVIRRQLSDYDFITVRDNFSYDYIKKNVPRANCEKYPDMAFSLPDEWIPDIKSEGMLGISVHNSVSPYMLAAAADGYIEKTGRGAILMCFNTGAENDSLAAENVLKAVRNKDNVEIVRYTTIQNMLCNMKRCGVIMGIRLHSIVLAARMGIPFVPVAYSEKTTRVLEDINYTGTVYGTDCRGILKSLLLPPPFTLDTAIINSAKKHIIRFNEHINKGR